MNQKIPYIQILYLSKDITTDVSDSFIRFSYTDNETGKSDEISLVFDDSKGLWANEWYPEKGDQIEILFGYNDLIVGAGLFDVDQISISGLPRRIDIRAISASASKSIRSKKSFVHENKTLRQIVQTIADQNELEIVGNIADIPISRTTQSRETDLSFLYRLGKDYGYIFNIRANQLIFTNVYEIEANQAVFEIELKSVTNYSFTDKLINTYSKAQSSYTNPIEGTTVTAESSIDEGATAKTANDTIIVRSKSENKQQAEAKAKAKVYFANTFGQTGRMSIEGNPLLLAGNNVDISGFGALDGKYQITSSTHSINKNSGYKTDIEIKRVSL